MKTMYICDEIDSNYQKDLPFQWCEWSFHKRIWFGQALISYSYADNKYLTKPLISIPQAEKYLETYQTSKVECFSIWVNGFLQNDPSWKFDSSE